MGTIGIRVLAGGALSGREERHPLGMQAVEPIGSGSSYKADVGARGGWSRWCARAMRRA